MAERCQLMLQEWRGDLTLSAREHSLLAGPLVGLDRQLARLRERRLRAAVFGRVGVGKSSLLNALLGEEEFATDVAHGCTRKQQAVQWQQSIAGLNAVELVDTPGIDEIGAAGRARLAGRVARTADLVLLVIDADLTGVELEALGWLLDSGKPLVIVLNRCDCWPQDELRQLEASIRRRLPGRAADLTLISVAAAPRQARLRPDGRVRTDLAPPQVSALQGHLITLLEREGEALLALNTLRAAESVQRQLHQHRLSRSRREAQGLIGRYAAIKATGVAANPLLLLDLAGGLACDTALVKQLCELYGLPVDGPTARQLLLQLCRHNALLGGAQLGIQLALGSLRQLLLLATPFTGGLSLASAAPVALAQAALAVHTTRRTGQLAARQLLRRGQRGGQPGAMLRRLAASDPLLQQWLRCSLANDHSSRAALQTLLP